MFKKAFVHLVRIAEDSFWKGSNVFELYGLDFMMDDKLNLWFIECNGSPQFVGTNPAKTDFFVKMLSDMWEIQYSYFRSRMSRVKKLLESKLLESGGKEIDFSGLKGEFERINRNYIEEEFRTCENNSFSLIMDKNLEGEKAYFGYLEPECIDF